MRNYCIGCSKFFEKFKDTASISIDGIFDNAESKWGDTMYDYVVEKPYYADDIDIYISVKPEYHLQMIKQLLELGYRTIHIINKVCEGTYEIRKLDYQHKNYELDKRKLILLYLEHASYAGIVAIKKLYKDLKIENHGFIIKEFVNDVKEDDYYYNLLAARYVMTERHWPHYKNEAVSAKVIQIWHGFPLKAMERMTPLYDESSRMYMYEEWKRYKYILSYGLNYTVAVSACFAAKFDQFAVTGMPRNDLLFYVDGKANLEQHFPECRGKRKVLYMPTFREIGGNKNGNDSGYVFYWEDFKLEKFKNFCRKNNVFFIFKLHPSDESKVRNWCEQSDCMGILNDESLGEQCTYEFLNGVDILITDYSSVYYDYMLLDRPIIFTNQDEEEYLANRGFIFEPSEFWRPGPIVNTMDDLQREIENALQREDSHKEHRKQLMPFVHKYTDGNSTQRLFDLLKKDSEKTNE